MTRRGTIVVEVESIDLAESWRDDWNGIDGRGEDERRAEVHDMHRVGSFAQFH